MEFTIANRELKNAHPNTARVVMENAEGRKMVLQAYSIGGGRIRVSILDGIEVDFSGESNTLIVPEYGPSGMYYRSFSSTEPRKNKRGYDAGVST